MNLFNRIILLVLAISIFNCASKQLPFYIGTYTDGDSEGIYKAKLDISEGKISDIKLAIAATNPSFLALSPNNDFLYSVNQLDSGYVSSYEILSNGNLKFINSIGSNGSSPCHITVDDKGALAAVSNYGGGTVSVYNLGKNGNLQKTLQVFNHNTDEIQSHAHSAQFSGDRLYVSDLGRNNLFEYRWSEENRKFKLNTDSLLKFAANSGPRHFVLMDQGKQIYSISEYANTITFAQNNMGNFEVMGVYKTLSPNFNGESYCADIHFSKDGGYVYGSNRGENSIAVFKRNKSDGSLELIQNEDVRGDWPRNFVIDPTGSFLLVANQRSNDISVFKIDSETGKLSFKNKLDFPSPVCLLFKR